MWTAEEKSYLWLDSFPIAPAEKNALVAEAGGAVNLVRTFAAFESCFVQKGKAELYRNMLDSLRGDGYFKNLVATYERKKIMYVTRGTDGYPSGWKGLPDAPCVVYGKGDLSLLKTPLFTVVGSRRTEESYRKRGEQLSQELSEHFTVLTGAAEGGDEAAAKGALRGGKVICMLAGGFDYAPQDGSEFLQDVQERGAVITVCPPDTSVRNYSYERRNKLLAYASVGTLVLSAGEKSGALKTAEYARQAGKPVFAFPYSPNSPCGAGCNALIKKGAVLTENLIDISSYFGINLKEKKTVSFTGDEECVFSVLQESGTAHVSELSARLQMPVYKVIATLSKLEMKGLVAKAGGNRFSAL